MLRGLWATLTFDMITSRQNPIVARYRAAARGDDESLLLLDGVHLVGDALAAGVPLHDVAVASEALSRDDVSAVVAALERAHVPFVAASATVMAALSPVRSPSPVVALARRPTLDSSRLYSGTAPLVVIAVDVQDPGNLGAIVRAAEAAGATGLVAAGACANPFGWKALRGSMGSALRVPLAVAERVETAIDEARRHRCHVVATAPRGGRSIFDVDFRTATAMLIGPEGSGLPPPLIDGADERVTIPMQAPVESLNAAVTAARMLYEARRQRTRQP